jgi:hypothetical protein
MRAAVMATILLASSSLYPATAQDQGKVPLTVPQTTPVNPDQNSPPQIDQRAERDRAKDGDREVGRDWRMRRHDGDRMDREMGQDERMPRDREMGRDRGQYGSRDEGRQRDPQWDRADRDNDAGRYRDEDRPRSRVKICIEYENGDEHCRYKQNR